VAAAAALVEVGGEEGGARMCMLRTLLLLL